eukprot:6481145-Amphidinium_carterae.1
MGVPIGNNSPPFQGGELEEVKRWKLSATAERAPALFNLDNSCKNYSHYQFNAKPPPGHTSPSYGLVQGS